MSRLIGIRPARLLIGLVIVLVAVGVASWVSRPSPPAPVAERNAFLPVVDGPAHDQHVRLDSTVYFPQHTPAPAILLSPGFGGTKASLTDQAQELARRGFVVLTYTPRGFGASTGLIALNSPDYEVADARQLIDWLGNQPEVTKDGPDDPRVGVTGGSYGGALALMLAGTDRRVDAIAPVITYNDLSQALVPNAGTTGPLPATGTPTAGAFAPNGVFKRAWAGIFFAAGLGGPGITPQSEAPQPGASTGRTGPGSSGSGSSADTGPTAGTDQSTSSSGSADPAVAPGTPATCGRFIPEVCQAYQQIATTGQASQQTIDLLRRNSPATVTGNIGVPTMLVEGEHDTLFGLDQADANARQIAAAGGKVTVVWYDGGHDGGAPGPALRQQIGDWFDFHLAGRGTDPGTAFQYDVQGSVTANGTPTVRTITAPAYPGLTAITGTPRRELPLAGPSAQQVLNPAGGNPAAVSGFPGLGGGTLGALTGRLANDIPGEFAAFTSAPLNDQLLVTGGSTVTLTVRAEPGQASGGQAVLFAKLYDIAPNSTRTLPGAAVAPVRIDRLPADGTPVTVAVTLPGIVQPVQAGHRLQLVVSTTDTSYANLTQPASLAVSLASGLSVPVVPGRTVATPLPTGQLIAIGVVLGLALLAGAFQLLRRRRRQGPDRTLAGVPLVLNGLRKSYRGGVVAVDDLSFRVEVGQVVGLLGPNGAGKTTALRMMMGLVRPSGGSVSVFGHPIRPGSPVLSRIGSFVEGAGFLPHLSGLANLHLYWAATGRPVEQARFDEALEIAGLGAAVRRKVGTYSHGMRQRLAIAQAMLGLPDLLVLDEPTNGLDPPQIRDMREVLRRYAAAERTVLVSSHLLTEVEQTCTHVVVMHLGRLMAAGPVGEIVGGGGQSSFTVDDPKRAIEVLHELPGLADADKVGTTTDGQVYARLNGVPRSAAVDALVRAGVAVDQAGPRGRLEDAFLELVDGPPHIDGEAG